MPNCPEPVAIGFPQFVSSFDTDTEYLSGESHSAQVYVSIEVGTKLKAREDLKGAIVTFTVEGAES